MSLAIKQARFASQGGRSGLVQEGGFFGSVFGGIKKLAKAVIPGANIPISIAEAGIGALRGRGPAIPRLTPPPSVGFGRQQPALAGAGAGAAVGTQIACASGFHPNKSSYFLSDGSFVAKGSRCVKNRRRNPMNPRALDRAISRVDSGKRLQHKLSGITTRKYSASGARKAHTHG